ncbi:MAG: hypothetical protein JWP63_5852 [Candidatus Solibacter sp.]|nr:hypothetical protein [Candidatus Solibacter sp.]
MNAARAGTQELPGRILDLDASSELEIVPSRALAGVSGTVFLGADRAPAAEATVVLVPEDPTLRSDLPSYTTATTDDAGKFTIPGVAPGRYRAFAWDGLQNSDFRFADPDVIFAVDSSGVALDLAPRANSTVELIAIGLK